MPASASHRLFNWLRQVLKRQHGFFVCPSSTLKAKTLKHADISCNNYWGETNHFRHLGRIWLLIYRKKTTTENKQKRNNWIIWCFSLFVCCICSRHCCLYWSISVASCLLIVTSWFNQRYVMPTEFKIWLISEIHL